MLLENKIGIVTGGGSGIGRAAAIAMGAEGATVVIGNRSVDKGESACHEIEQAGGRALFIRTDCSSSGDCEALVATTEQEFGRLDVAFNNAGMFHETLVPIHEMSLDEFHRGTDLNYKGTFYCMKYELAAMLRAGGGVICNNASIFGVKGMPGLNWYTGAKHGILGLTKCAALEYADQNIRVNVICPGNTKTPPMDAATGGDDSLYAEVVPMKRLAAPEEIGSVVVHMLSEQSSYMTGAAIHVDGGMIAA